MMAGNGLAGDDELGVEAGRALHHPGVPVVVAFERRRLDPAGPGRRDEGQRVAVRSEVRDRQDAVGVAQALAADRLDGREEVGVEDDL